MLILKQKPSSKTFTFNADFITFSFMKKPNKKI